MHKRLFSTILLLGVLFFPQAVSASDLESYDEQGAPPPVQDEFYKARVFGVVSEGEIEEYGRKLISQTLDVEIVSGSEEGGVVTINNQFEPRNADQFALEQGDKIVLGKTTVGGDTTYYISDVYRLNSLWVIGFIFAILVVVFARWAGVRSFLGLLVSFAVIVFYIVPQILAGANPLFVSFVGAIGIAVVSIFLAHGLYKRTAIAFVSTLITIVISLGLATWFVSVARLFGLGTEEAFFVQAAPDMLINIRGLLLGGIIIGVLGVLDDITTAQAAAVEQIHKADPTLSIKELYMRGSAVGREHILSLVNTLVLAYVGASLPLLLLFRIYERPAWVTLNSEIVMEELVRMFVGSIALIIAVPITTILAAYYFGKKKS